MLPTEKPPLLVDHSAGLPLSDIHTGLLTVKTPKQTTQKCQDTDTYTIIPICSFLLPLYFMHNLYSAAVAVSILPGLLSSLSLSHFSMRFCTYLYYCTEIKSYKISNDAWYSYTQFYTRRPFPICPSIFLSLLKYICLLSFKSWSSGVLSQVTTSSTSSITYTIIVSTQFTVCISIQYLNSSAYLQLQDQTVIHSLSGWAEKEAKDTGGKNQYSGCGQFLWNGTCCWDLPSGNYLPFSYT